MMNVMSEIDSLKVDVVSGTDSGLINVEPDL